MIFFKVGDFRIILLENLYSLTRYDICILVFLELIYYAISSSAIFETTREKETAYELKKRDTVI